MGEVLAMGNVAVSPVLASEALLADIEQAVVQWIAIIWDTPVATLMVDCWPPWPRSWHPSPRDQPWFTHVCDAVHALWQAARWAGESGDMVASVQQEFCRV